MNVKDLVTFGLGVLDSFKTKNWQSTAKSKSSFNAHESLGEGTPLGNEGGTHHAKHDTEGGPQPKES